MELQTGFEDNDFAMNMITIIAIQDDLRVKFKVMVRNHCINESLYFRLIYFKAHKKIKEALKVFPNGGYIKYTL